MTKEPATITLSSFEIMLGSVAGVMRALQAISRNAKEAHGRNSAPSWTDHVEGALAEQAVAKFLGVYWAGAGKRGDTDIGGNIEVRWTSRPEGRLILRQSDKELSYYVLVTGFNGAYGIAGWIQMKDAIHNEWWTQANNDRPGAWFVPQTSLHHPEELKLTLQDTGAENEPA